MPVMDGIQAMEKDLYYVFCGTHYRCNGLCILYRAAGYSGRMQRCHIETLFRGKTERNDRILYWLINFLKGNQHSGNCSVIKIIITL